MRFTSYNNLLLKLVANNCPPNVHPVTAWLQKLGNEQPNIALAILPPLARNSAGFYATQLRAAPLANVVSQLMTRARESALNATQAYDVRRIAIDALALDPAPETLDTLQSLIGPAQPLPIQRSALSSMQRHASREVADILLAGWASYTPKQRREIANVVLARVDWQETVRAALLDGRLQLSDFSAAEQQQLQRSTTKESWRRIQQQAGIESGDVNRQQVVDAYRTALHSPASIDSGRKLFRKHCASCHRVEYYGSELGPNLAAMQNRGADAILTNVLNPNQEVNPQYLAYNAIMNDGRVINGMIRGETATSIELVQADNKSHTLLRVDIDDLTNTRQSLMPTGLEQQITPTEMNDLINYLLSVDGPKKGSR